MVASSTPRSGAPIVVVLSALAAASCNVPEPPASSGGVHVDKGPCGRGTVVVQSDYLSTNVGLAGLDGTVLSGSFVSSGARSAGVSTALSGDVVAPSARPESDLVVLIDRYPNGVLTWLDPGTAMVQAQLSVATGFASNPHDYVELGDGRAYVSRYENNAAPGRQPWDGGGDLLIVRWNPPEIVGRIALGQPDDGALLPRPDRMQRLRDRVWVLLQRFDASFANAGDARVAGVDPSRDAVDWLVTLPGYASCGAMAASPSGESVVVVCSGAFRDQAAQLDRSGVVLLDASHDPPSELRRFDLAAELGAPVAPAVGFLDETHVLGVAYGDLEAGRGDQVYALDLSTGAVEVLAASGDGFELGEIRCAPGCGEPCLLADAGRLSLRRWRLDGAVVRELPAIELDDGIGLPPRWLGGF